MRHLSSDFTAELPGRESGFRLSPPLLRFAAAALAAWSFILAAEPAQAQGVGFQEYYVIGRESHVYNMMERVATAEGAALGTNSTRSVVSMVAASNGQRVYYDHWEDGLDTGLDSSNPSFPMATQAQIGAPIAGAIARAVNTVTVTAVAHGYATGNVVVIAGAAPAGYNGAFAITVTGANTFTYQVPAALGGITTAAVTAVRRSTVVFGDSDLTNGRACDFTNDPRVAPCNGTAAHDDTLFDGTALTLDSPTVALPRLAVAIQWDGGDRIVTSGGPLSLIHNQDPQSNFIGGSVEVLSRQAYANATSYSIPAGEDLYTVSNTLYNVFQYVDIDIVAFQAGTNVTITSPGAGGGTVSFTLNQGQHYTNRGCSVPNPTCPFGQIDDVPNSAPFIRINSGTKIATTGPLAGMIHAGGDGNYATDIFPILPDLLHGNDYLIPSLGDDAAVNGNRPMNLYLFNPDPVNVITISATDSVGTRTFTVNPNSTENYFSDAAPNRFVPANSTVRLTSSANFWGLTSHDHQTPANDWGYAWLATKFLTNNYTVGYSPGVRNPPAQYTARLAVCQGGTPLGSDALGSALNPAACNTFNRSPVWVGATADGTRVKVDFNGDGLFDYVDLNSDDFPDDGAFNDGTCAPAVNRPGALQDLNNCVYSINALQALRVYDWTDYDNTGTQIVANKPISVVYGQDTDQATGGDPIQDTGYTIYPTLQAFLDPVLTIGKTANPTSVSSAAGGVVTFSLTVRSYLFGGLTALTIFDDLPATLTCAALAGNYVTNSSRITYPNLSQQVGDLATGAACAVGGGTGGRDRLSWTVSPNTLGVSQTLTVDFQVNIPAGAATSLLNDATARALLGSSVFEAAAQASVVRTDVVFTKSVVDDNGGQPEFGDTLTYTLVVTNNGVASETGIVISDAIPASTVFLGPVTGTAPFTGAFFPAQNSVVWTNSGGPFIALATATLTFKVTINSGSPAAGVISNFGNYSSAQTPSLDSNTVNTTVVSPVLVQSKSGPALLVPGEVATFEILVQNTGAGSATNVRVRDPLAGSNMTYVATSMRWSLNGGAFSLPLDDLPNNDPPPAEGTLLAGPILELLFDALGPGEELRFRFQATVNGGTGGLFAINQASVNAMQVQSRDTNLLQIPIANATVTGHLFLDLDGNGVQNGAEQNLPNVTVVLTAAGGQTRTLVTDANGNYSGVMPAGSVTAAVNGADPDIPPGSVLTTAVGCVTPGTPPCNNSQTVTAVANATVATSNVGYQPPPLQITKVSSAGGTAVPGQVITYTVTVTNNTPTPQTGITLNDVVPANTTYVDNSAQVTYPTGNAFRVTEYVIPAGQFTGTIYDLTLTAAPLLANYFAIVQGSSGDGTNNNDRGPDSTYARITQDPFGTGELEVSAGASTLRLERDDGADDWIGVVTVVECLSACTTAGFRLLDVLDVDHPGAAVADTNTDTSVAWGNINQTMLMGGFNGAGCLTAETDPDNTKTCHVRLFPSGANTVKWTRNAAGATLSAATSTVMVVEWGSQWTVQRVRVQGTNGGNGVNIAGEYNPAALPTSNVDSARTWVWGTGHTDNNGIGDAAEGVVVTLGNGVTHGASETTVAVATENGGTAIDFEVWALTHPGLTVSHTKLNDQGAGEPDGDAGSLTEDVPVPIAAATRMALSYNSSNGTSNNFPRPMFSARYFNNTTIRLERRRSGDEFAAWVQGIDFSGAGGTATIICNGNSAGANQCSEPVDNPNVLVPTNALTVPPGTSLTLTFQVMVSNPLGQGVTQISNTAGVTTTQQPTLRSATATDNVSRPGVKVEPNNSGFVPFNAVTPQTIFFTQGVKNTGSSTDSFTVTLDSDLAGWKLELIDPATGAVIATDTNGDGVWDGGITVSTGSLAPGATRQYTIRATVPANTPAGTQNTVELTATSGLSPLVKDVGTDEITVLPAATFGPVVLLPDHTGIVAAGQSIAYTHRIFNNTGAAETFDLIASSTATLTPGWTSLIFADTNGDGVYTAGIDLEVANTANLPNGGSQILFVVVTAPAGANPGEVQVTDLTARSRTNPAQVDSVTDTTTIPPVTPAGLDLSGGGTRMVAVGVGDIAVYPGTLYNLTGAGDRFDFSLTTSSLFGVDGLNHPTELWVDSDNNGSADLLIARDIDGNGTWDSLCGSGTPPIAPACSAATYNASVAGGNALLPDVLVGPNGALNYELRRPIDPLQAIWKEYVTLSATSVATLEKDSVTAQWIIAALSRASIRGLRVNPAGVVEFVTGTQRGTKFFNLYETNDRSRDGEKTLLNASPVLSPAPDSALPILYRVETAPITGRYLLIEETETSGNVLTYGPYSMTNTRLRRGLESVEARMNDAEVPDGNVRVARRNPLRSARTQAARAGLRPPSPARELSASGLRLEVAGAGELAVPMADLLTAGLPSSLPHKLVLTNAGRRVPYRIADSDSVSSLIFNAVALETDYTETNPYVLTWGSGVHIPSVDLTRSFDPARPGYTRVERNSWPVAGVIPGSDPWQWDALTGDGSTWPYAEGDPTAGQFDLPRLVENAAGNAPVVIRLTGATDHQHQVTARINGMEVGALTFTGVGTSLLTGSVPVSDLRRAGNELSLTYSSLLADGTLASGGFIALDYADIAAPMSGVEGGPASLVGIEAYRPALPALGRVQYLIVTHPLFKEQADRLAALKQGEGLRAVVVSAETAYDRYSGGVLEPQAVAALIRRAAIASSRLKYVVLFGDDTFDPRNFLGGNQTSFLPSIMGNDGSFRIPNENAYADLDGDGSPDLAIGRLPVTTVEEAMAVVDKIEQQTATLSASGNVHVFVNDDSHEIDAEFDQEAIEMSQKLPAFATSVIADVGGGIGLARQTLFGSWGNGVTMTHYFGHGGPEIWTDEALLSVDDTLPEGMSPMVLLAWACQSQWYLNYFGPTINESLFLSPGSGSLASFGPVGISSPAHQREIYERVYQDLYTEGLSIGEIIRRAKVAALAANPGNRDVVDGFMFFGDPSLRIPQP